jgi:TctA family transporter
MAILFPATFGLSPTSAIIMLSGIYYGDVRWLNDIDFG